MNLMAGRYISRYSAGNEIIVRMLPYPGTSEKEMDWLKEELTLSIQTISYNIKGSIIHFAWVKGSSIVPEASPTIWRRVVERLFSSALLLLYMMLFTFSIILFIFFGLQAVLVLLVFQILLVIFADRIYLRMGKWRITEENPEVYILRYHLSEKELAQFREHGSKRAMQDIKAEIYERTFAVGKEPSCSLVKDVLGKNGIVCSPDHLSSKTVNVHRIVAEAASRYQVPTPKIVVSNNIAPNAAATGPGPKRGVVLITVGLLLELNDEERS